MSHSLDFSGRYAIISTSVAEFSNIVYGCMLLLGFSMNSWSQGRC